MCLGKWIRHIVPAGIVLCCLRLSAQQGHPPPLSSGGADGRLTVTATVVASVGLVTGPDGEQHLIVANAADPRDNVSHLDAVSVKLTPVATEPEKKNKKPRKN